METEKVTVEDAHELDNVIRELARVSTGAQLDLGIHLYRFKAARAWELLGYESWRVYVASITSIGSYATVQRLVRVGELLYALKRARVNAQGLSHAAITRLDLARPAILDALAKKEIARVHDWLEKVKTLGPIDLRKVLIEEGYKTEKVNTYIIVRDLKAIQVYEGTDDDALAHDAVVIVKNPHILRGREVCLGDDSA